MKKIVFVIFILCVGCSSSDTPVENEEPTFNIELSANLNAVVDEVIAVTISSNETMSSLGFSFDNFETGVSTSVSSKNEVRYFSFDKLGTNTVYFSAKNSEGVESVKTLNVNVTRGNAVKIIEVKVISFSGIDTTWDIEFSDTDVNRLADVIFALRKPKISVTENVANIQTWFISNVKENQGDLTWDVSDESLYLNPEFTLQFSLSDDDGGGIGQDLMFGPPLERAISFQEQMAAKPSEIILKVDEIDLEVVFQLEWAN